MNKVWNLLNPWSQCNTENVLMWLDEGSQTSKQKAMDCLYRKLCPQFEAWVLKQQGEKSDGHDALTDALVAFMGSFELGKYKEEGKLENFIFVIAKNKFYNIVRKRSKEKNTYQPPPEPCPPKEPEEPKEEPFNLMEKCFNELGERCRMRITLRYFSGLSFKEITPLMGDASVTVSKIMNRKCLDSMRKCMFDHL